MRARPLSRLAVLGAVWLSATGALGQCELFRPAPSEPPPEGTAIVPNYSDPDLTLDTIAKGIASRGTSGGDIAFRGALADSQPPIAPNERLFRAFFDPLTESIYLSGGGGTSIPEWTRTKEESFFQNYYVLQNQGAERSLVWLVDESQGNDVRNSEDALLHRKYLLLDKLSDGTIDTSSSGFADLYFILFQTDWVLVRWDDREDPNRPTGAQSMGLLRLNHQ